MEENVLLATHYSLPSQQHFYKGKVRDVYTVNDLLVMVVSDRISAFDVVLPKGIPFKGQVLNQIALKFMKATEDIVPNWVVASPDPNVTIGKKCEPFKIEMVIRGYLAGHAWREYKAGKRILCGAEMPEGLKEGDAFPEPIITPATKAEEGHDEDISLDEIVRQRIVSKQDLDQLVAYTRLLFQRGTEMAKEQGLILVDTKYEFGKDSEGNICLIDEIHTPDSSRYYYDEGYEKRQQEGEKQKQLSKEFVREWLMENGFQGKEGQSIPEMTPEVVSAISARYIELFEQITGQTFKPEKEGNVEARVEKRILAFLANR